MELTLKFGKKNSKLEKLEAKTGKKVYSFSTLSGWDCPFAKECQSFAVETPNGMKIKDGKYTKFRFFSASQEVLWENVYKSRKNNSQLIKLANTDFDLAVKTVIEQFPKKCQILRINVAGDMKTQTYFDMWLEVIRNLPTVQFYAYTKALPYWVARLGEIPDNFNLTASFGGRCDNLIEKYNLRYAKVVFSKKEAKDLGLVIDHDDSHAALNRYKNQNFALLLHNSQPKGSLAAKALSEIRRLYNTKK